MMSLLSGFSFKTWLRLGLAAVVALAVGWVVLELRAGARAAVQVEALTAQVDHLTTALAASEAENAAARARHARDLMRVANAFDEERARLEELQDAISAIDQAPDSDDGPLAPVLKDTLRRLP